MDPRSFQTLAVQLAGGDAAHRRTALSRSYYALFNTAAAHLKSMGFRVGRGAAAHGEVQHCLANCGDAEVVAISAELNELHRVRNRADYQIDRADIEHPGFVTQTVAHAGEQIRALDSVMTGPRRLQLQPAIARWRRENGYP